MKKVNFLDTNVLLSHLDFVEKQDFFLISSITLIELENIKISKNKSDDVRYSARCAVRFLTENTSKYEVIMWDIHSLCDFTEYGLEDSSDNRIMRCAEYARDVLGYSELSFYTNDLLCRMIAKNVFRLNVCWIDEKSEDDYKGFITKTLSDVELAYFYEHQNENVYNMFTNEYLILKDSNGEIIDKYRWDGNEFCNVKFPKIKSNYFGDVKPYNGDIYQQLVLNSLSTNQITMIKGSAGTGKSYLAIGYMMWLLEKHKIEKIVIFANPTPTYNSAKIGFLPGTQLDKIIDSSVGNMLGAKLGDKILIEQLVAQNKLTILPMCDIRGFDTSSNSCVYITEAQNMDISLMKLVLQRIGEGSYCIIDGDYFAQTDLSAYDGMNNGMRRMSEIFRGEDCYGEVELQNIYRSKIANIAEKM